MEWLGLVIASLTEFRDWKHSLVIWQFLQNMGRLENFWKEVLDILPFPRGKLPFLTVMSVGPNASTGHGIRDVGLVCSAV